MGGCKMRRSMICTVLAALIMTQMLPVGTAMRMNDGIPAGESAAQDYGECETAQEMVDKITMGWNLGLSLSPYLSPKVDRYVSRIVCRDTAGNERRSPTDVYFDPAKGTASIHWQIGSGEAGAADTALDRFELRIHNTALSDGDTVTIGIDGFSYTLTSGKTVTPELSERESTACFKNGSGSIPVCEIKTGLRLTDIKEISAEIHFVAVDTVGVPPRSVEYYETVWGNPVTT